MKINSNILVCNNILCPLFSRIVGGQGHGVAVRRRHLRRKHQAVPLPLSRPQDVADSAGERHHNRVHQK